MSAETEHLRPLKPLTKFLWLLKCSMPKITIFITIILQKYGSKVKVQITDTDSFHFSDTDSFHFYYQIEDIYADMKRKEDADLFDLSEYPMNHVL